MNNQNDISCNQLIVKQITNRKRDYIDLLLLADEEEAMIDKYLTRGYLFVLFIDDTVVGSIVITNEGNRVYEIKNLAITSLYQRKGYGKYLINYIIDRYKHLSDKIIVGTGESPLTVPFYEHCGFIYSHRIPNFFADNYPEPIFEEGIQLIDMVYLKKEFY